MARIRLGIKVAALAAVVAVFGVVAGCGGGGGGSSQFDFNGTWVLSTVVTASNVAGNPVGEVGSDTIFITQGGSNIIVEIAGLNPLTGVCDPNAGTFSVAGVTGPTTNTMTGGATGSDTMSGTFQITAGPFFTNMDWTGKFVRFSRAVAQGAATGGIGAAAKRLR